MPAGSFPLRFLHISDLHACGSREAERWRRRRVLGPQWTRHLDLLLEEEGGIDLVFFTGDAAQSGKKDEFDEAGEFLTALRENLGIGMDRVFTVPGNHDIDRDLAVDQWAKIRMLGDATRDTLGVSRWMNGIGRVPFGFEDSWRTEVLERERAYREWVRDGLQRPELAAGGLGYRAAAPIPWPFPIHIIGLDTGWLCGDKHDTGQILLTENQVGRHATTESGDPLDGFRIALMHHPVNDLADARDARRMLAEHVDIVLRGHLHQTEIAEWIDPDRRLRELAAGSLYEGGSLIPTGIPATSFASNSTRAAVRCKAWRASVRSRRAVGTGSTMAASTARARTGA